MPACLQSALFPLWNPVLQPLFAPRSPMWSPTMWCPWLYSVHAAAACPTLASVRLGASLCWSGRGASLSPHGFPTPPSQHQGCLRDPSHLPVHLESFSVASLVSFPEVRGSVSYRLPATATNLSSLLKPRAEGESHL